MLFCKLSYIVEDYFSADNLWICIFLRMVPTTVERLREGQGVLERVLRSIKMERTYKRSDGSTEKDSGTKTLKVSEILAETKIKESLELYLSFLQETCAGLDPIQFSFQMPIDMRCRQRL